MEATALPGDNAERANPNQATSMVSVDWNVTCIIHMCKGEKTELYVNCELLRKYTVAS